MESNFESLMQGLANHIDFIYKQNIKPTNIIFDIINKKLILDLKHDDFIDIFGSSFHIGEIQQYGNNSFVLERIISVLNILIILKVNISEIEIINKNLSKICTN